MSRNAVSLLTIVLMLSSQLCLALPEDKQQLMYFHADSADLNHEAHRGIYLGHVAMDQGTTHMRAQEAVTEGNEQNKLMRAVIKGGAQGQAHYWTMTTLEKPVLHAYADTIYYYPEEHLIELVGNARVVQGNDSFTAPKIRYDIKQQRVMTEKQRTAQTAIVIHPEKHS